MLSLRHEGYINDHSFNKVNQGRRTMSMTEEAKKLSDLSFLDPETLSAPGAFYERLHEECPVYKIPETGMFMVTKYDDLRAVLKDAETFSSNPEYASASSLQGDLAGTYQEILREKGWGHVVTLQRTDPPTHSRYRKLLDRVFTPKRVRELTPHIEEVAHELVDEWIDQGTCEFNFDFAMKLPGIIIAEQLGLDRKDVATFKKWADAMLAMAIKPMTADEMRQTAETELEAQHFLAEIFEQRRKAPGDDIMSGLVHAHGDDEEPLTMHELQNLMHQLITGGFETTQSAIAHGMWRLVRSPELQDVLRHHPDQTKSFAEEVLRHEGPVQGLARYTTRDTVLNGTPIPKNSMVIVRYGAANLDEEKFACPHQFDMTRKNVGAHLAFGSGAHHCVGAFLGRQEMVSSFNVLLSRLKNIELARPLPTPVHDFSLFFIPMKELHIRFDKNN